MKIEFDPLYFLVSLEACLVLFIVTLFLLVQNRKYKKLYRKSLKDRERAQMTLPEEQAEEKPSSAAVREEQAEAREEEPLKEEVPVQEPAPALDAASWDDVMSVATGDAGTPEGDLPSNVRRLQRMVVFQKNTILELMCYKEIFEGTQRKLDALWKTNGELQEKLLALNDGNVEVLGLSEPINALEGTNHDVEKFINVLGKENSMLSEKFMAWEEEFRRIAEDLAGDEAPAAGAGAEAGGGVDEARYTELLQEKEDLERKISGYEERLKEQTKQLDEIQKQYEDLEKEYMILYRQQQQQQQQEQQQQQGTA